MLHFNLKNVIIGALTLVLGADKLFQQFNYGFIPISIPDPVFFAIMVLAGIILLVKGLGLGKHQYYT